MKTFLKPMLIALMLGGPAALVPAAMAQAATAPQPAASGAPVATAGKMLVDANGARLGAVDRVDADGSAELILDGHVVTVPAATLSLVNGKLTTSLKKGEVEAL